LGGESERAKKGKTLVKRNNTTPSNQKFLHGTTARKNHSRGRKAKLTGKGGREKKKERTGGESSSNFGRVQNQKRKGRGPERGDKCTKGPTDGVHKNKEAKKAMDKQKRARMLPQKQATTLLKKTPGGQKTAKNNGGSCFWGKRHRRFKKQQERSRDGHHKPAATKRKSSGVARKRKKKSRPGSLWG